jgi:hypothetical protein
MKRGRKAVLTTKQRWAVGAFCEDQWHQLCERQTFERHDALPHMAEVRELQMRNRRWLRKPSLTRFDYERDLNANDIDAAIARARTNRLARVIRVSRPYAEAGPILGKATFWCWQKFKKRITREYARDCWDSFRECEAELIRASGHINYKRLIERH